MKTCLWVTAKADLRSDPGSWMVNIRGLAASVFLRCWEGFSQLGPEVPSNPIKSISVSQMTLNPCSVLLHSIAQCKCL